MKRCWLGAGILVLLLVLGLASAGYLARFGEKMSREIEQAALTAADPDSGRQILGQVRRRWEKIRFALAVFSDHAPLQEADTLFALLENTGDPESFRENALRLARLLSQLGQVQKPKLENIL